MVLSVTRVKVRGIFYPYSFILPVYSFNEEVRVRNASDCPMRHFLSLRGLCDPNNHRL